MHNTCTYVIADAASADLHSELDDDVHVRLPVRLRLLPAARRLRSDEVRVDWLKSGVVTRARRLGHAAGRHRHNLNHS